MMFSYRESTNKIFVASSNITDNTHSIDKLFSYGVAGVITKTICMDTKKTNGRERIWKNNLNLYNTTKYSKRNFEDWFMLLQSYVKENKIVIPSIYAVKYEELNYIIQSLWQVGVVALEIGISCPNEKENRTADIVKALEKIIGKISIPVYVKLCAEGNVIPTINDLISIGVRGIILSDSFPSLYVKDGKSISAGLSGEVIRTKVIQQIESVRSKGITCEIVGTGGIFMKEHIQEYLAAGADAVGICSCMYIYGIDYIQTLIHERRNTL